MSGIPGVLTNFLTPRFMSTNTICTTVEVWKIKYCVPTFPYKAYMLPHRVDGVPTA